MPEPLPNSVSNEFLDWLQDCPNTWHLVKADDN